MATPRAAGSPTVVVQGDERAEHGIDAVVRPHLEMLDLYARLAKQRHSGLDAGYRLLLGQPGAVRELSEAGVREHLEDRDSELLELLMNPEARCHPRRRLVGRCDPRHPVAEVSAESNLGTSRHSELGTESRIVTMRSGTELRGRID
jgi:hypothetical protein